MDITQAILAVKVSPKLRRAQFDCELARPNGGEVVKPLPGKMHSKATGAGTARIRSAGRLDR